MHESVRFIVGAVLFAKTRDGDPWVEPTDEDVERLAREFNTSNWATVNPPIKNALDQEYFYRTPEKIDLKDFKFVTIHGIYTATQSVRIHRTLEQALLPHASDGHAMVLCDLTTGACARCRSVWRATSWHGPDLRSF